MLKEVVNCADILFWPVLSAVNCSAAVLNGNLPDLLHGILSPWDLGAYNTVNTC